MSAKGAAWRLPDQHRPLIDWLNEADQSLAFVHAAVPAQWLEGTVGVAYAAAEAGYTVGLVTTRIDRVRHLLRTHIGDGLKLQNAGRSQVLATSDPRVPIEGFGALWIIGADVLAEPKRLSADPLDLLFCAEAHQCERNPSHDLHAGRFAAVGEMPGQGHWFVHHQNTADALCKLPLDVVGQFEPEALGFAHNEDDPHYARKMLCEDVDPVIDASEEAFDDFCQTRLFVRSDKPLDNLTERQRDYAKRQGRGLVTRSVPMDPHYIQKEVSRRRAQAVAEGRQPWLIVLKARRTGMTSIEQARSYWTSCERPGNDCVTLAHTKQATQKIFGMVRYFAERDPRQPRLIGNSKVSLQFDNGSTFYVLTAGGASSGRGDTLARAHWAECAFSCRGPNQSERCAEVYAGLAGAAGFGEFTLESTPNGREWFWQQWVKAREGDSVFTPVFFRWFDDPINRKPIGTFNERELLEDLDDEERDAMARYQLDVQQMAFRREFRKKYGTRLFLQEMAEDDESCFLSAGQCWFDTGIIIAQIRRIDQLPKIERQAHGGREKCWQKPLPNRKYVIGVDTSEGIEGCDPNGLAVLDKETGRHVYDLHGYFNPAKLAEQCVRVAKEYNNALLGIERNNHGHAVLQKVDDLGYGRSHRQGGKLYFYAENRAGWNTDTGSREVMLSELAEAVDEGALETDDRAFWSECSSFRLNKNKWEADDGAFDDRVMKMAIAWQMRRERSAAPRVFVRKGRD